MSERESRFGGTPLSFSTYTTTRRWDMAQEVTVTCPKDARYEGDLEGCGHTFTQEPDEEGFFDCPECGLFFNAEGLKKEALDAN
jgi:hypothetical protein